MGCKKRSTHEIDREYLRIREHLWEMKGRVCMYCGRPAEELHHIIPRHMGGDNRLQNIVPLCKECHSKAHSRRVNQNEWRAGRSRVPMPEGFDEVAREYIESKITFGEALARSGTKKNVFYRLLQEYREETGDTRQHKNIGNRKNHRRKSKEAGR